MISLTEISKGDDPEVLYTSGAGRQKMEEEKGTERGDQAKPISKGVLTETLFISSAALFLAPITVGKLSELLINAVGFFPMSLIMTAQLSQ